MSSRFPSLIAALSNRDQAAVAGSEATAVGGAIGGTVAVDAGDAEDVKVEVGVGVNGVPRVEDGSGVAHPATRTQSSTAASVFTAG